MPVGRPYNIIYIYANGERSQIASRTNWDLIVNLAITFSGPHHNHHHYHHHHSHNERQRFDERLVRIQFGESLSWYSSIFDNLTVQSQSYGCTRHAQLYNSIRTKFDTFPADTELNIPFWFQIFFSTIIDGEWKNTYSFQSHCDS